MQIELEHLYRDIKQTYNNIHSHLQETPLLHSSKLDHELGVNVYLKAESMQTTGSFKLRGALSAMSRLSSEEIRSGVLAYSSGNHAQGVAHAANCFNAPATIVMPKDAPGIKLEKTKALGAKIISYDRIKEDREAIGERIAKENNLTIIRPYDAIETILGQATAALEIVRNSQSKFDAAIICAGGGGLTAGCSIVLKHHYPDCRIFTAEPEDWNDHELSFANQEIIGVNTNRTGLCDGLLAPQPGNLTFAINTKLGVKGLSCPDQDIYDAMLKAYQLFDVVLEPSGAVALACLLKHQDRFQDQKVMVMLSGGNVDAETFQRCIDLAN